MANSVTELTLAQQQQLMAWCRQNRACMAAFAQFIDKARAVNDGYNGGVSTILGLLASASDVCGDTNGLDGNGYLSSGTMTKQNHIDRVADLQAVLTTYDTATHRQLWSQGCGLENL
jgi:hypothetical protein